MYPNGKPFASSRIRTLNRGYLPSPINRAITCFVNALKQECEIQ